MNPEETEPVVLPTTFQEMALFLIDGMASSGSWDAPTLKRVRELLGGTDPFAASLAALQAERDVAKQSGADWYYRMQRAEAQLAEARRAVKRFNSIVDAVEARCMAVDGPVTPTLQEMTETELSSLWKQTQVIRSALSDAPPLDGVGNTNGGEEQP
jgi:hypothetical protein